MEDMAELIERLVDNGQIETMASVDAVLLHEFFHWVIQNNPALWAKLRKMEGR